MKNIIRLTAIIAISSGLYACNEKETSTSSTVEQKASYSFGVDIAKSLTAQEIEIDIDALAEGLVSAYKESALALNDEEMKQAIVDFRTEVNRIAAKEVLEAGIANKEAGEAFLEENAKKEGVVITESGLQYKVLTEGEGETPKLTDTVTTHYKGTLIDGTEFDSSYKRNAPTSFPVNAVIKGWTEALQLMPVGSKWQLFIPSDLAYGPSTPGKVITANSALIFEIELLSIKE